MEAQHPWDILHQPLLIGGTCFSSPLGLEEKQALNRAGNYDYCAFYSQNTCGGLISVHFLGGQTGLKYIQRLPHRLDFRSPNRMLGLKLR